MNVGNNWKKFVDLAILIICRSIHVHYSSKENIPSRQVCLSLCVYMSVCVCVWEKERERESKSK